MCKLSYLLIIISNNYVLIKLLLLCINNVIFYINYIEFFMTFNNSNDNYCYLTAENMALKRKISFLLLLQNIIYFCV